MSKELVRPGILPRHEFISAGLHDKVKLMTEVHKMVRRGEIGATYDMRQTKTGWHVKIVRIAERPSWWSRNGLKASLWSVGGLGLLGIVVYLVRLVLILLAGAVPYLIGGALLLAAVAALGGGRVIHIVQRVDIRR